MASAAARLVALLLALGVQGAAAEGLDPEAGLAADDECRAEGCGLSALQRRAGAANRTATCGGVQIFSMYQGCCGGKIFLNHVESCCGDQIYKAKEQGCCGTDYVLYDPLKQNCCDDVKKHNLNHGVCDIPKGKLSCCMLPHLRRRRGKHSAGAGGQGRRRRRHHKAHHHHHSSS
mmetsp:Transcript_98438/g.261553  ORF Transcript_98438/g.261553 Transcript_98438/m.261553 type:complete len:175 (-) Transcript_98438:72-596(-)